MNLLSLLAAVLIDSLILSQFTIFGALPMLSVVILILISRNLSFQQLLIYALLSGLIIDALSNQLSYGLILMLLTALLIQATKSFVPRIKVDSWQWLVLIVFVTAMYVLVENLLLLNVLSIFILLHLFTITLLVNSLIWIAGVNIYKNA